MRYRASRFAPDQTLNHPIRLSILLHLLRQGGRDHLSAICELVEPASRNSAGAYCKNLEDAGYLTKQVVYLGRGKPRTWLEVTPAGRDALVAYRNSIVDLIDGAIAPEAMQLPETNAMEANTPL